MNSYSENTLKHGYWFIEFHKINNSLHNIPGRSDFNLKWVEEDKAELYPLKERSNHEKMFWDSQIGSLNWKGGKIYLLCQQI